MTHVTTTNASNIIATRGQVAFVGRCRTCGEGYRIEKPAEVDERCEKASDETIDEANERFTFQEFAARMEWIAAQPVETYVRTIVTTSAGVLCCGKSVVMAKVRGTVTDHECDARCIAATGPRCECSCGGENHGRMFLPVAG